MIKAKIPFKHRNTAPKLTAPVLSKDIDVLHAIRYAARNLLVVQITYTDSKGITSVRETEPYEIKEGKYWAYCLMSGGVRQFTLHNIQSATALDGMKFRPRYPVKIL